MSYKNVVFVKLMWKELLLEDNRFTDQLNDEQKGLYLMLILLAGATNNRIPSDPKSIKRMLNLHENEQKIAENVQKITEIYPKLRRKGDNFEFLMFLNFKDLHNWIGNSHIGKVGVPRIDKNRIDKIRIEHLERILLSYRQIKEWIHLENNPAQLGEFWKRNCKSAKALFLACGSVEKVILAIENGNKYFSEKKLDWTLETILKHLPELTKEQKVKSEML